MRVIIKDTIGEDRSNDVTDHQYVICKGENQIADIKEAFPLCGGGGMQRGRGR